MEEKDLIGKKFEVKTNDEMGVIDQNERLDVMDKIIAYAVDYRKSQKKD